MACSEGPIRTFSWIFCQCGHNALSLQPAHWLDIRMHDVLLMNVSKSAGHISYLWTQACDEQWHIKTRANRLTIRERSFGVGCLTCTNESAFPQSIHSEMSIGKPGSSLSEAKPRRGSTFGCLSFDQTYNSFSKSYNQIMSQW